MSEPSDTRVIVCCYNEEGIPTLYPAKVSATDEDVQEGQHYAKAVREASEEGYELPEGHIVCIDRKNARDTGLVFLFQELYPGMKRDREAGSLFKE